MPTPTQDSSDVEQKIEAIRAMDPADPHVSSDGGPCRLNPGEDARLRRAKEEKVAESRQLHERTQRGAST